MKSTTEKAYAKINLTFYITGESKSIKSGYHTIDSIMQGISLCDTVKLTKTGEGIKVKCDSSDINEKVKCNYLNHNEKNNLAYIAADLIFREYKEKIKEDKKNKGIKIKIYKQIPFSAGLGGGSSDAAAVIRGMDRLYGLGMDDEEMIQIAAEIGMDVPFFILGGTVHATRQGQKVERIKGIPNNIYFVLAKPNFSISTKEAYTFFDYNKTKDNLIRPDMLEEINKYMFEAIKSENIEFIAKNLYNDFDSLIINGKIKEIEGIMKESGVLNALMSGSGSTVFGITEKKAVAENIRDSLKKDPYLDFVRVAYPHNIPIIRKDL
jgi:4-diphosphocytidyl-2-C-methyl-D-erythritol kinase